MAETKIEWATYSFNPWWGCAEVSPGCASECYAKTFARRLGMSDLWPEKGPGGADRDHAFRFFGDKHWQQPLRWAEKARKDETRPRVFCASMADVFEERAELDEHRDRLFDLIEATPELDWLILTKRPEFARDWLDREHITWAAGAPSYLPNVWLGVSIENARFTWRADVLREIPAAVRFISAEPLLGSLFEGHRPGICGSCNHSTEHHGPNGCRVEVSDWGELDCNCDRQFSKPLDLTGIDWVIVGGESGPKARPFHIEHAREIIRACGFRDEHGQPIIQRTPDPLPALFVKQLGARPVFETPAGAAHLPPMIESLPLRDRKGGDWDEWPADLRIREFPRSAG